MGIVTRTVTGMVMGMATGMVMVTGMVMGMAVGIYTTGMSMNTNSHTEEIAGNTVQSTSAFIKALCNNLRASAHSKLPSQVLECTQMILCLSRQ